MSACRARVASAIVTAVVSFAVGGCSSAQRAAIVRDSGACVLDQVPTDLIELTRNSILSTPGAPTWATFSQGELLSKGIAAAICVVSAVVRSFDRNLPGELADGSGRVAPMALVAGSSSAPAPACSNPQLLLAHDRAVDFLNRYGVEHSHAAARVAP